MWCVTDLSYDHDKNQSTLTLLCHLATCSLKTSIKIAIHIAL